MTILLSIDAALLRAQLPQLVLRTGQAIAARVVERHGRYGIITIAGAGAGLVGLYLYLR